jgi:hypothetical protein
MSTNAQGTPAPTQLDIVDKYYQDVLAQYETDRQAEYENDLADAHSAWLKAEDARKQKFINSYMADCKPLANPYEGKTPAEVYRLSRPYDTRIQDLLAAAEQSDTHRTALLAESLKCVVYRNRNHVAIGKVQEFLKPYVPVNGNLSKNNSEFKRMFDFENISPELYAIVHKAHLTFWLGEVAWILGWEDVPQRPDGPNRPLGWCPPQRWVLAHQTPADPYEPRWEKLRPISKDDY